MNNIMYIYALCDLDNSIRYIGQSKDPQSRYRQHILRAPTPTSPKSLWIQKLIKKNQQPLLKVLEETTADKADLREKWWIEKFNKTGKELTNVMDTGGKRWILSFHLGKKSERGLLRKEALERIARRMGHSWNSQPSIGRWLVSMAEMELSNPPEENYDCDQCGREFVGKALTDTQAGHREIVCSGCADELLAVNGERFHRMYVSP